MGKLTGFKIINIAVFISGNGTNFKNLIKYSKKKSKYKINLVVSDNSKAAGLIYAQKYKIKKKIVNYHNVKNSEKTILTELQKNNKYSPLFITKI